MKKWFNKQTVTTFILGAMLMLSVNGYADTVFQFSQSNNTFYVDGTLISKPMYKYQNTNYASIRSVAEMLGLEIKVTGTRVDITRPLTSLETVAKNCKDSCVMIYAYKANNVISQGSGWVYNGYVVTAKHVVEGATKIDVFTDDSLYSVPGTVYYTDKTLDVALIKADTKMPSVKLGDSSKLVEGQKLVSITSPHKTQNAIDECTYSGKTYDPTGYYLGVSDSFIESGSSGGPIFNYQSEFVGMAILGGDGLGTAIYSNDFKSLLDKIK